jgi:protein subunit release factor A
MFGSIKRKNKSVFDREALIREARAVLERLSAIREMLALEVKDGQNELESMKKMWLCDCESSILAVNNALGVFKIMLAPRNKGEAEELFVNLKKLLGSIGDEALAVNGFYSRISTRICPLAKRLEEIVNASLTV